MFPLRQSLISRSSWSNRRCSFTCGRCLYKVDVRYTTLSFVPQSSRSLHKVEAVCAKFERCLHKIDVVCSKFCTKKEENRQVNFEIKNRFIYSLMVTRSSYSVSARPNWQRNATRGRELGGIRIEGSFVKGLESAMLLANRVCAVAIGWLLGA